MSAVSQGTPFSPDVQDESPRSSFNDLSHSVNFTFSPGTAVPTMAMEMLPGDQITYGLEGQVESFPMLAPNLDGFKFRNVFYFCDLSNIYGWLDNNSKITTDEFINSQKFFSCVPITVPGCLPYCTYPQDEKSALPTTAYAWCDPKLANAYVTTGVAPGNLLNALGLPVGYNGLYSDLATFASASDPSPSCTREGFFLPLRVNLNKLFSYLDAYRVSLANLQERYAYYIGAGVVNYGYVYKSDGSQVIPVAGTPAVPSTDMYTFAYKYVTLQSMDAFMSYLRYCTSSPSVSILDGGKVNTDLYISNILSEFFIYGCQYMLHYAGISDNLTGAAIVNSQPARDAVSAMRWFLEVTGLQTALFPRNPSPDVTSQINRYFRIVFSATSIAGQGQFISNVSDPDGLKGYQASLFTSRLMNGGYFLTTYEMDLSRGLLSTSVGVTKSSVSVSGNSFTIDQFRFANSVQKSIDRFDISGGRFSTWLRRIWSVKADKKLDCAEILHVASSYVGVTDVISTSGTQDTALAQQAGYSIGRIGSSNDYVRSDSYGILMCISSLVPVVSYSQGLLPSDFKLSIQDLFMPQYSNIGFQDVPLKELDVQVSTLPGSDKGVSAAATNTPVTPDQVVGRRLAWQEYRIANSRSFGQFASGAPLSYWTLLRSYSIPDSYSASYSGVDRALNDVYSYGLRIESQPYTLSTSTYVWPRLYNYLFAQTDDSAQNFRMRARVVFKGSRPVPVPSNPSLG
ncbi:MAG: major capsid protein [Microviridae sp.]|nr:MAG: major capsid protein [Microviridae sp.]